MVFAFLPAQQQGHVLVVLFQEGIRGSRVGCFPCGKAVHLYLLLLVPLWFSLMPIRGLVQDFKPLKKYWQQVTHH